MVCTTLSGGSAQGIQTVGRPRAIAIARTVERLLEEPGQKSAKSPSKLYFCIYKSPVPPCGNRLAAPRGGGGLGLRPPTLRLKTMKAKCRQINIRLTEDEYRDLKDRSKEFYNMTQYVLLALREYSGASPKAILEQRNRLTALYRHIDLQLAHMGGNLNQAMKRVNELAACHAPYYDRLVEDVLPLVTECHQSILDYRRLLRSITSKTVSGGAYKS